MKYNYNGNLLNEDRIIEVAKDIQSEYPEINFELAKNIATLEAPITTEVTDEIKFRRIYNILLFTQNNKSLQTKLISKIVQIYKKIYGQYEDIDKVMENMKSYYIDDNLFPFYN